MKKREVLAKNELFLLVRQQRDHKIWYEIQMFAAWHSVSEETEEEISMYFGNSTQIGNHTWRFWNRIEAHTQFTYTTLRWC